MMVVVLRARVTPVEKMQQIFITNRYIQIGFGVAVYSHARHMGEQEILVFPFTPDATLSGHAAKRKTNAVNGRVSFDYASICSRIVHLNINSILIFIKKMRSAHISLEMHMGQKSYGSNCMNVRNLNDQQMKQSIEKGKS